MRSRMASPPTHERRAGASFRPLYEREHDAAQHYAPDAVHEIDLLTAMLDQIFTGHGTWSEALEAVALVCAGHARSVVCVSSR